MGMYAKELERTFTNSQFENQGISIINQEE